MKQGKILGILTAAALCTAGAEANATLSLTPVGTSDGFTITTFADFSSVYGGGCCGGPFGMAVTNNGNVLVSVGVNSTRYVFNNVDGQTPGSALFTQSSDSSTASYATVGGQAYGWQGGQFVQFNNDGTVNHVLTGVTPGPFLGAWGNTANGHIVATSSVGLIDINPLAAGGLGSFTVIPNSPGNGDGVSTSPDGLTVYVEQGNINGYLISTGASTSSSGGFIGGPDGTATILGGAFNGFLIVNSNNGDVDLLDVSTGLHTTIATGSSPFGTDRGDYVQPDQKGCLFLAEGNRVDRLCIAGASIGTQAPEPASLALLGVGLAGLGILRRRRAA